MFISCRSESSNLSYIAFLYLGINYKYNFFGPFLAVVNIVDIISVAYTMLHILDKQI